MKKNSFFAFFLLLLFCSCNSRFKELTVGDTAPIFSLKDQNNNSFSVKDYLGKKMLVIYFYPKDESGVCTKEACAFRDGFTDYTKAGAMVIGINNESVETHKKFGEHHNLPFVLLSDPTKQVINMFGVKDKFFMTGRETFIVDLNGKIAYVYNSFMQGEKHSMEALNFIKSNKK